MMYFVWIVRQPSGHYTIGIRYIGTDCHTGACEPCATSVTTACLLDLVLVCIIHIDLCLLAWVVSSIVYVNLCLVVRGQASYLHVHIYIYVYTA